MYRDMSTAKYSVKFVPTSPCSKKFSSVSFQDASTDCIRFFSPPPSPLKNPGLEPETFAKSPFIIGVAGGTASGKVGTTRLGVPV